MATAQVDETSYTDEEHGVTISWTDQWVVDASPEDSPFLALTRDSSITVIIMIEDGQMITPEDVVWSLYQEGDELIEDGSSENPPYIISQGQDTGDVFISEAHSINNGDATVFVGVSTIPVLQSASIGITSEEITINGSPVLTGLTDDAGSTDADATAETSGRDSRSSRDRSTTPAATTESEATEQPEDLTGSATVEPTEEITRTSRTGSDATETPVATEEPTTEPTEIPTEEPTTEPTEDVAVPGDAGTYTSPVWGYTFTYDTTLWNQVDTFESPTVDSVRIDGESTTVFFTGTNEYGADPVACLEGEDAYFSSDIEDISDWELTIGANGDSLKYESDELAWGVFSYTFHSSTGADVEFVDYISCETIPGEDAVLIVQMTSFPDEYNNNLDAVLDILETLEFAP